MKNVKRWLKVLACTITLGALLNGCFGSFGATRLLYNFNDSFGNKFVKTLIMWVFTIVPAYELFIFADWLIINTIEFWMGSNPISGDIQYVPNEDGSMTAMDENGNALLKFTAVADDRMLVEHDGVIVGEMQVDGNKTVKMINYATSDVRTVDLTANPNAVPAM